MTLKNNAAKLARIEEQIAELRALDARDIDGIAIVAAVEKHGWDVDSIAVGKLDRAIERNDERIEILTDADYR